jgi:hypothetical protein
VTRFTCGDILNEAHVRNEAGHIRPVVGVVAATSCAASTCLRLAQKNDPSLEIVCRGTWDSFLIVTKGNGPDDHDGWVHYFINAIEVLGEDDVQFRPYGRTHSFLDRHVLRWHAGS